MIYRSKLAANLNQKSFVTSRTTARLLSSSFCNSSSTLDELLQLITTSKSPTESMHQFCELLDREEPHGRMTQNIL